jgi:trehalose synthase
MSFTSITAVLRAAGLAADHHHHARAVFERLDASGGTVEREARVIEEQQLRLDTPVVAQISRWDRLKDPLGVIQGFADHVAPHTDAHLVYAGPAVDDVADDPI